MTASHRQMCRIRRMTSRIEIEWRVAVVSAEPCSSLLHGSVARVGRFCTTSTCKNAVQRESISHAHLRDSTMLLPGAELAIENSLKEVLRTLSVRSMVDSSRRSCFWTICTRLWFAMANVWQPAVQHAIDLSRRAATSHKDCRECKKWTDEAAGDRI